MLTVTDTSTAHQLPPQLRAWVYNGLDCCVTREALDNQLAKVDADPARDDLVRWINFLQAVQGPALTCMFRGINTSRGTRVRLSSQIQAEQRRAEKLLDRMAKEVAGWAKPLNARSFKQLNSFFYEVLGAPRQYNKAGRLSCDKECLPKIAKACPAAEPFVATIAEIRGYTDQLRVVKDAPSEDGRVRFQLRTGGTVNSRFSCSSNPFKDGTNVQNVNERLREMFVPDLDMTMFYADLAQVQSRIVAYDSQDERYINFHLSGDVHTQVGRMLLPDDFPWTGDLKLDRKIAEGANPPWDNLEGHSWRFYFKKLQHSFNFGLTPRGLSYQLHMPVRFAERLFENYFGAFPGIERWHNRINKQLVDERMVSNPLGWRRYFFGRVWDRATQRDAYAAIAQSMEAAILKLGMWRIWKHLDGDAVQILLDIHDAVLGQVKPGASQADLDALAKQIIRLMLVDVPMHGRVMTVPVDIKFGANWRMGH